MTDPNDKYKEKFYKNTVTGRDGNLFTKVDWLMDQFRKLRFGDTTNFITQIIQNNQEIIMPSIPGGTRDPTSASFTGVIISPNGILLPSDGILYTFAIVVNGVAVWGTGDDGGTPVESTLNYVYGSMYCDDAAIIFDLSNGNTPYQVDSGMTQGLLNGCAFQNSREIKVSATGMYEVAWSMSVMVDADDQIIQGLILAGGGGTTPQTQTANSTLAATNGQVYSISGGGLMLCAANDIISLGVSNETTGGTQATVVDANMTVKGLFSLLGRTIGGADTNVQYNDGGVLAGDANFTWDKTAQMLVINSTLASPAGVALNLSGGDGGATDDGGGINITSGDGGGTSGDGGAIGVQAGSATGADSNGGEILISPGGGTGTGDGGDLLSTAGTGGATGNGGEIQFTGGVGGVTSGDGGNLSLQGGAANGGGDGGDITLTPGAGEGGGVDGVIILGDATNGIEVSKTGELLLLGTAKYERHIQIEARVGGNVSNQPAADEVGTAGGFQFASSGPQEELHIQWEVPDDWDGGAVQVEIDWLPDSGAMTNPDAVKWTFEYYSVAAGESIIAGTMGTKSVTYNTTTAQNIIVHSPVTLDDANQPLAKQDHVFIRVLRDTGVANDFPGTAFATAFEILYTSNGFPTSN